MLRKIVAWTKTVRQRLLWRDIALVLGWNELAKMQPTLGARIYCRMHSFDAENDVNRTGLAKIPRTNDNAITITVDSDWRCPGFHFRESDWELMRVALAEHDAKIGGAL